MNYIDVLIIIFIGLAVFEGFRKGFIKMIFETLGLIIAFFISKGYSYIVGDFLLTKTSLYSYIHDFFQTKAHWLTEILQEGTSDVILKMKESLFLPQEMQQMFADTIKNTALDKYNIFVNNITEFVFKSLSFLITFLVVYMLLLILCNVLDTVLKLPVLNLTNKLGGLAVGALKGVLLVYLIFALASPFIAFLPQDGFVSDIKESKSHEYFYNKNIILNYLSYKGFYDNKN